MKKETFVGFIKLMRKEYLKFQSLDGIWLELFDDYPPLFIGSILEGMVETLEKEFDTELISWWLWDSPKGIEGDVDHPVLWDKEKVSIDISTPEKLYDYLMEV